MKTLPGYFPATTRSCNQVSQEFFDCFSSKAVKSSDADVEAGEIGLQACKKELLAYKQCMDKSLNDKNGAKEKRFRVSSLSHKLNYVVYLIDVTRTLPSLCEIIGTGGI